jgi:glycosyltransferase involved in cell wall biosynthesis
LNPKPKISVIIPNFNHAEYLKQRLDSVMNQTCQEFEVIILDDCSTDNSREIIEQYRNSPKISHIIYNDKNSGSAFRQWQKGIDLSKGEYIWIAESDDYCVLNFLEKMISPLKTGAGLAYCRSARVDGEKVNINYFWADGLDPAKWKKNYLNSGMAEISEFLIYRNTIPNASSCVFRKECIDLGLEISDFRYAGDWLFWINLLKNSSVSFTAETLNFFRIHARSTRAVKSMNLETMRFKEYFYVINNARSLCRKGKIKPNEFSKYKWIMDEYWSRQKIFGIFSVILPLIPINHYRIYYLYLIDKMYKKITNA